MLDQDKALNWLTQWSERNCERLSPVISGAKRGLQEGIGIRFPGFETMFRLLIAQGLPWVNVIETGTLRNPGNWKDGQSSVLFTEFVEAMGGTVRSIDIDASACESARRAISNRCFSVYCDDSVSWLTNYPNLDQVDLFYLDSWDVKWHDDHDSAQHHLREFHAIEHKIRPGAVVAIDDNARFLDGRRTGKGRCIVEYLDARGHKPLYDAYQIIYQF